MAKKATRKKAARSPATIRSALAIMADRATRFETEIVAEVGRRMDRMTNDIADLRAQLAQVTSTLADCDTEPHLTRAEFEAEMGRWQVTLQQAVYYGDCGGESYTIHLWWTGELCMWKLPGDNPKTPIPTLAALRDVLAKHCKPRLQGDGPWTAVELQDAGVLAAPIGDGLGRVLVGDYGNWSHCMRLDRVRLSALARFPGLPTEFATAIKRALGEGE